MRIRRLTVGGLAITAVATGSVSLHGIAEAAEPPKVDSKTYVVSNTTSSGAVVSCTIEVASFYYRQTQEAS